MRIFFTSRVQTYIPPSIYLSLIFLSSSSTGSHFKGQAGRGGRVEVEGNCNSLETFLVIYSTKHRHGDIRRFRRLLYKLQTIFPPLLLSWPSPPPSSPYCILFFPLSTFSFFRDNRPCYRDGCFIRRPPSSIHPFLFQRGFIGKVITGQEKIARGATFQGLAYLYIYIYISCACHKSCTYFMSFPRV